MRLLIQRVLSASIVVDGMPGGEIGHGMVVLAGFCPGDTQREVDHLAVKLCALRIFDDNAGNLNRSVGDVEGSLLLVPNFTLYASCKKGRRPAFVDAMRPEDAAPLFVRLIAAVKAEGHTVQTGKFGADMQVTLTNDGPVTILLDSAELMPQG